MRIRSWMTFLLYAAGFAVLARLLVIPAGFPVTWDELAYMGLAFNPEADTCALNRYTHIYLLSFLMWLTGDPYRGARALWAVTMAGTILALGRSTFPLRPALRMFVLLLTLLLGLTADVIGASLGIAYADFTVMLVFALAVGLVLPDILRGRAIPMLKALLLGVLIVLGLRAKEVSLVLGALVPVLWIDPQRGLRPTRGGSARVALCAAGGVLALAALVGLDAWLLGDPTFLLRPGSWRALWASAQVPNPGNLEVNWLSWLLRPENFTAFLVYAATIVPLAVVLRDLRATLVAALPMLYLLQLVATYATGNSIVVPRYVIAILPIMYLVAALGTGKLLELTAATPRARNVVLWCGSGIVVACLLALCFRQAMEPVRTIDPRFTREVLFAGTIFAGVCLLALGLAAPRACRAPAALTALALICVTALPPALRVTHEVIQLQMRRAGALRFGDLRDLTRGLPVDGTTRFLVAQDIYRNEGLGERNPYFFRALLAMNTRFRLTRAQVTVAPDLSAVPLDELHAHDYVIATPPAATDLLARVRAAGGVRASVFDLVSGARGQVALLRKAAAPATTGPAGP